MNYLIKIKINMIQRCFSSKRNPSIEFYRIIGSLIVIGVHSKDSILEKINYEGTKKFISCIFADGVSIFWFILGFYLFKSKDYYILIKKFLKRIYVKYFALGIVFIISEKYFSKNPIFPTFKYIKNIFHNLLIFQNPFPYLGHSWYLYTYFLILFLYPVLKQFINYLDEEFSRKRNFIIIALLLLVINDYMYNQTFKFSHRSINSVFPSSIQVILGYFLKNSFAFKRKKYYILLSASIFYILNIIRTLLLNTFPCKNIIYWYSSFGAINALMIFIFSVCVIPYDKCEKCYHYFINYVASNTFGVYLIHIYVKNILLNSNFGKNLISLKYSKNNYIIFMVLSLAYLISIIFIISMIIVIIYSFILNLFIKLINLFIKLIKNN